MKILPHKLDFKGNITQQIWLKTNIWQKKIQAPEVAAISMQLGELKLYLWTSIGSQKISITWIDLKILSHKLEERAQIFQ